MYDSIFMNYDWYLLEATKELKVKKFKTKRNHFFLVFGVWLNTKKKPPWIPRLQTPFLAPQR